MIIIHEDPITPDAVADNIKLLLGDVLEHRDDIPLSVTFDMMLGGSNGAFKNWIIENIRISLFVSSRRGDDDEFESFSFTDVQKIKVDVLLMSEVFFILGDVTREEFVAYRKNLIAEMMSEQPRFVEA